MILDGWFKNVKAALLLHYLTLNIETLVSNGWYIDRCQFSTSIFLSLGKSTMEMSKLFPFLQAPSAKESVFFQVQVESKGNLHPDFTEVIGMEAE